MKLLKNNEPELEVVSDYVAEGSDLSGLFAFMRLTMETEIPKGVGLAASQVDVAMRAIVIKHAGIDINIINPEITKHCNKKMTSEEECLSCPGIRVSVGRFKWVIVKGFDENWKPVKRKFHGFMATIVQHEIDHLNGITLMTRKRNALLKAGD